MFYNNILGYKCKNKKMSKGFLIETKGSYQNVNIIKIKKRNYQNLIHIVMISE